MLDLKGNMIPPTLNSRVLSLFLFAYLIGAPTFFESFKIIQPYLYNSYMFINKEYILGLPAE